MDSREPPRRSSFGLALARERQRRGWSQQHLGLLAGVSQRHVSFLETGRSQPGRAALTKLLAALELDVASARRLLVAAGFGADRVDVGWNDPEFGLARRTIESLLARHDPLPGLAIDIDGSIVSASPGLGRLLAAAGLGDALTATSPPTGPNLYDLTLHPAGVVRALLNPHQVVPHTLRRLAATAANNDSAAETLRRVSAYPVAQQFPATSNLLDPSAVVVTEDYGVDGRLVRFVALTTTLGRPEEPTAQNISVELLSPADRASHDIVNALTTSVTTD